MFEDLKKFTGWLAGLIFAAYFLTALIAKTPFARDDSDPGEWGARSGLAVLTDHLTGCQYLASRDAGLTPRLDGARRHVGCR